MLSVLGYDPSMVADLEPRLRTSMQRHGVLWLVACVLLAVASAVAAWTALPSYWTPVAMGLFVLLLTVNLLRVSVAGGGVTPADQLKPGLGRCKNWRPSMVPMLVFLALGLILSQPAQLMWWRGTLDPQVESYREVLLVRHERAAAALGVDATAVRQEIEHAGFPLQRLKFLWQDPQRAGMWTLFFCFLMLVPGFWSRWIAIDALRVYEQSRARQKHRSRVALMRGMQRQLDEALRPFRERGRA